MHENKIIFHYLESVLQQKRTSRKVSLLRYAFSGQNIIKNTDKCKFEIITLSTKQSHIVGYLQHSLLLVYIGYLYFFLFRS